MSSAKNVRMWHRVIEKGVGALDKACRRADLHQSNVWFQREASRFIQ